MNALAGKTALVTGGAGGLGGAICARLAKAGALVLVHDLPSSGGADIAGAIVAAGGRAEFVAGDLADLAALKVQADGLVAQHGPIEVLVNNAAINPHKPVGHYDIEEFERVQRVNSHAAFFLSQAVIPGMKAKGGGAIVNIASITFAGILPDLVPYVFSKGSLIALTRALAREVGPDNIRVNAISPGAIPTELERKVWAGKLHEIEAVFLEKQALKFRPTADDIAESVLFLVTPASRFITGHELHVNGGWYMG